MLGALAKAGRPLGRHLSRLQRVLVGGCVPSNPGGRGKELVRTCRSAHALDPLAYLLQLMALISRTRGGTESRILGVPPDSAPTWTVGAIMNGHVLALGGRWVPLNEQTHPCRVVAAR